MKKLVFATGNEGKMKEIRMILGDLDYEILSMKEAGIDVDIVEDGKTFEENAILKATAGLKETGFISVADDSGICVDALGGAPGIYSARYAGEGHNDDDNNEKLLAELVNVPESERTAYYVCAICCCFPDGRSFTVRGECHGRIGYEYKGEGGFGYDPLFLVGDGDLTFGELTDEQKDELSHRGKALRDFAEIIKEYI